MEFTSTSATLLLERPERPADVDVLEVWCGPASTPVESAVESALLPSPTGDHSGLGFLLRAPGLVLLATVFVVVGYFWLGVLPVDHASAALLSGRVGVALLSVGGSLGAVVLTRGRRVSGLALEEVVIGVAVAVTVATITTLVVGGPAWRAVAGIADLVLAASVFGAAIRGELAPQRSSVPHTDRSSAAA